MKAKLVPIHFRSGMDDAFRAHLRLAVDNLLAALEEV